MYSLGLTFAFLACTLFLTHGVHAGNDVPPGNDIPLGKKVHDADFIIEVEIAFDKPIPGTYPTQAYDPQNWHFPPSLITRALRTAKILRYHKPALCGTDIILPQYFHLFSPHSPCWLIAHTRLSLRALLFFREAPDGTLLQISGEERETGQFTSLNPRYDQLVIAIKAAISWEHGETATGEDKWKPQREAIRSGDNPYEQLLAANYLLRNGASSILRGELTAMKLNPDEWEMQLHLEMKTHVCVMTQDTKPAPDTNPKATGTDPKVKGPDSETPDDQ